MESAELLSRLGDEDFERLRRIHFQLLRDAVATSGGEEVKNLGDGLMVVFPSALDAIGCAVAMQQGMALHNAEPEVASIEVRVGVHAGEPIREEDDYFGTPVVIAKRLCDTASGGQIVVSELVAALVGGRRQFSFRTLGDLELKGVGQPLPAREVVWREDDLPGDTYEVRPVGAAGGPVRQRRLLIAVVILVALLLAAGAFVLSRDDDGGNGGTATADQGSPDQSAVEEGGAGGPVEPPELPTAAATNEIGADLPDGGYGSLGEIGSAGEAQDFSVALAEGDLVTWLVTPVEPDGLNSAYIELTDSAGDLLGFDEDGKAEGAPAIWRFRVPADGDYTARVFSTDSNGTGRYKFEVFYEDELLEGRDPLLGVGSLGGPGSAGVWEVELVADDLISIYTVPHAIDWLEFDMKVLAPDGEVLIDQPYENEVPPYLENFAAPETGTYQLVFEPAAEGDSGAYLFEVVWQ